MKILVCYPLSPQGVEILREHAQVELKLNLSPEELKGIVGGYDALMYAAKPRLPARLSGLAAVKSNRQGRVGWTISMLPRQPPRDHGG